jgi:hypothetical protein
MKSGRGVGRTATPQEEEVLMAGKASKASGSSGGKRGRSAVTGRFVKQATVRRHPSTTVNERASRSSKKSK